MALYFIDFKELSQSSHQHSDHAVWVHKSMLLIAIQIAKYHT